MEKLQQKIKNIEGIDPKDAEYFETVLKKKERVANPKPKLNKKQLLLLNVDKNLEAIPKKTDIKERSKESWTKFLTDEETKMLVHMDPSSIEYKRLRSTCYTRRYYSDPENLKLQYARNKKYLQTKKIQKSEELKANMTDLLEDKKKKLEEKRKISNEKAKAYYHKMKNDPEFKKKEKEKNEKYRTEHKGYRKINYNLHKEGLLPLSEKCQARKENIKELLKSYELLSNFMKDYPNEHSFVRAYKLSDELYSGLYDYDLNKLKKTLNKEGLTVLDAKSEERKERIREIISGYKFLSDFRKEHPNEYQWVRKYGLAEELYADLYDFKRRKNNAEQREDINDPDIKMFRKCRRNADKCKSEEEFKLRFFSSWEFAVSKNIIGELEKLFTK